MSQLAIVSALSESPSSPVCQRKSSPSPAAFLSRLDIDAGATSQEGPVSFVYQTHNRDI